MMRSHKMSLIILVVIVTITMVSLLLFLIRGDWSESDIKQSMRRGDAIIAGLEKFKEEHGRYPESLQNLVPTYLKQIEPPLVGNRKWHYGSFRAGQDFLLEFADDSEYKPAAWFKPGYVEWNIDYK